MAPILLAGIGAKISPRVVPLWSQYLYGGAAPQNLSATFGADFTSSLTTAATTEFLLHALRDDIEAHPPAVAPGSTVVVDIPTRIPSAVAAIRNPADPHQMNFNYITEIPGNIAGGIGTDQVSCPVGARPSPFDDDRIASGTAEVRGNRDGSLTIVPSLQFEVKDTIDLCPGDCGAAIEQVATVPMSRFEASGVSGDVPFTVDFPAPPRHIVAHPATPPTPPAPGPGPAAPVAGEVTASALRVRERPTTASPTLDVYPHGTAIAILCQTHGTVVDGDDVWDRTDRGYVSDRYVHRPGGDAPPEC